MGKNYLLVFTIILFLLSACGVPAAAAPEPTQTVSPAPTDIKLSTATLLPTETLPPVSPYGIKNNLDKSLALPDGYVLYGHISWTDPLITPYGTIATLANIKDANGKEIPFTYADAEASPTPDEHRQLWAYKINATSFAPPLTLTFVVDTHLKVDGGSFAFDPGPNPQLGQKWDINQDIIVDNKTIHVLFAKQGGSDSIGALNFSMRSADPHVIGATITDYSHPPVGFGGGGGGIPQADVEFSAPYSYQEPLPKGPYTLTFTSVDILVPGDWNLSWSP
jgi:hypothetical protein